MAPIDRPGPRPMVIAHRGGAGLRPENTVTAFEHAVTLGADALELDVRRSRDDVAVVLHDATLDRTTDARGPVEQLSAGELASVDAAYHFQPERHYPFRDRGIGVPSLRDVLIRCPDVPVIIELKGYDPRLAELVVEEVCAAGAVDRVCVGSFGTRMLRLVRRREPRIATSAAREEVRWALYGSWVGVPRRRVSYRAFQVPEFAGRTRVVSHRFVRLAHRAGLPVQVWTVNEAEQARRLLGWGVDGLISDQPDVVIEALRTWERDHRPPISPPTSARS